MGKKADKILDELQQILDFNSYLVGDNASYGEAWHSMVHGVEEVIKDNRSTRNLKPNAILGFDVCYCTLDEVMDGHRHHCPAHEPCDDCVKEVSE